MPCTRRAFLASLAASAARLLVAKGTAVPRRPNVLFLLTDDQTFDSIHALGNAQIRTPHIDRLVVRGTAFRNCYNPGGWHGAICVASRTMLNTGRFLWEAQPLEKNRAKLEACPLWARLWREAGYATCLAGKWHVNADPKACFDQVRHVRPGMPPTCEEAYLRPRDGRPDPWDPTDVTRPGHWSGGKHWAAVTADDAIAFLREAPRDRPFFAYIALNAPHDPRQAPAEYQALYPPDRMAVPDNFLPAFPKSGAIGAPPTLRDERLAPTPRTPHAIQVHRSEYYALITYLDAQIGRVLDALDATGHAEDTIVVFASDNGLAVGQHGFMGKQNPFEHSIKVPLILAGPGIPQGQTRDALVYLQDIRPTLLELAGLRDAPSATAFRSFATLLTKDDAGAPFRERIYTAYRTHQRTLRQGDWKLIRLAQGKQAAPRWLLFNLRDDPHERRDLAASPAHAERLEAMRQALREIMLDVSDPLARRPESRQTLPTNPKGSEAKP